MSARDCNSCALAKQRRGFLARLQFACFLFPELLILGVIVLIVKTAALAVGSTFSADIKILRNLYGCT